MAKTKETDKIESTKIAGKTMKSKKSAEPDTWLRESIRVDGKLWYALKVEAMQTKQTISQVLNGILAINAQKKQ